MTWAPAYVPAIIEAWYPGGRRYAIADMLFGDYNPADASRDIYKSETSAAFDDYRMAGRTYPSSKASCIRLATA